MAPCLTLNSFRICAKLLVGLIGQEPRKLGKSAQTRLVSHWLIVYDKTNKDEDPRMQNQELHGPVLVGGEKQAIDDSIAFSNYGCDSTLD